MNESVTEQVNALTGLTSSAPDGTSVDWKQKYDELEKKMNGIRVEEGRVKKLDEELKARERELAELRASKRNEDLASTLSEEERSEIPEEVLNAATKLVNNGLGRMQAENERRFKEMEQNRSAERTNAFLAKIDARFPGLRSSITAGGDKVSAWQSYLRYNQASISAAFESGDFETFAYHVEQFYSNVLGIPVPSAGQDATAAPDPRSSNGGKREASASGKTYTQEEFMGLYDLVEAARDRGDYAEVTRLNSEIQKAPAEGRVK